MRQQIGGKLLGSWRGKNAGVMSSCMYSLELGGFFEKSRAFPLSSTKDLPELTIGAILILLHRKVGAIIQQYAYHRSISLFTI